MLTCLLILIRVAEGQRLARASRVVLKYIISRIELIELCRNATARLYRGAAALRTHYPYQLILLRFHDLRGKNLLQFPM